MIVTLYMAQSIDGIVSTHADDRIGWAGKEDRLHFIRETTASGVVIMGAKTFDTLPSPLKDRHNVIMTRRAVLNGWKRGNVEFTTQSPADILDTLSSRGYKHAALIGGPEANIAFARGRLIDFISVTNVPFVLGSGPSMFAGPVGMELELLEQKNNIFKYKVKK